ncbi:MAG: metal-dependent hydrolase [Phycisphaerae bacterium]|nr:metal-dependent hydrolase [Phycisphaerae bacterium]
MASFTYHGHSAVELLLNGKRLWIDPFLSGNPLATVSADKVAADAIIITHGHADHFGDAIPIAQRTGAVVVANYEITSYCARHGVEKIEPANVGGSILIDGVSVTFTPAWHSSSLEVKGESLYMGLAAGVVIRGEGKSIYHMGDTALFSDIRLIVERLGPFDVAFVPTGDRFTMGLESSLTAARWINPRLTVPIHHSTFPIIEKNAEDFVRRLARLGTNGRVVASGETIEF